MSGTVYTETVIHVAPSQFVSEAPYQLLIVALQDGRRVTGRMVDGRAAIGDAVELAEERNGVPYFRKL